MGVSKTKTYENEDLRWVFVITIKGLNETTHGSYRVILVKCDFNKLEKETENMSTFPMYSRQFIGR